MFEDEMTEEHIARTEAEYRAVTRQEVRDQKLADDRAHQRALAGATIAAAYAVLRSRS
ncbi:hypothetical protein [Bradyrhizobium sp. Tv2a-2]|uniref:hypothetical protein n=1 Tax=Bradyrhizobium sp. Tv2a-2 TaxID=113395 RepID=UPI0012ECB536|nr:hypothetical protein [Bradyrhizobium sp. Tv2a-2]